MTPVTQQVQWNVSGWRLKLKQTICSGATPEVESFQLENQHISRVKCVSRVHYSTGGTVLMAGLTAQLPHRDPQLWAWLAPRARDCQKWAGGGREEGGDTWARCQGEWAHAGGGQQSHHLVHDIQSHPACGLHVWLWQCVCFIFLCLKL